MHASAFSGALEQTCRNRFHLAYRLDDVDRVNPGFRIGTHGPNGCGLLMSGDFGTTPERHGRVHFLDIPAGTAAVPVART